MHFNSTHLVNKVDTKIFSNTTLDDFFSYINCEGTVQTLSCGLTMQW